MVLKRSRNERDKDLRMKARITKDGLLIPKEVVDRLGSEEVEITQEPGRLLIAPAGEAEDQTGPNGGEDPILDLGRNPVRTGVRDGSTNHDRYLYTGD
jgi:hypothetical protein